MFKKQFFPESTIKSLATNKTVFNRGQTLYDNGAVKNLGVDEEDRTIVFHVKGKTDHYKTQISFLKNGVARKYHCTCPAFQQYSGACKHVVCSMLHLNNIKKDELKKDEKPQKSTSKQTASSRSSAVLQDLKQIAQTSSVHHLSVINKERVNFEFVLNANITSFNKQFEFYLRVGVDHLYVIKNIPYIIGQLLDGKAHEFGKQFAFTPSDFYITDEDRDVLEMIYMIYNMTRSLTQSGYEISYTNKNQIEIPELYVPQLLEKMQATEGGFIRFDRPPSSITNVSNLEEIQFDHGTEDFPLSCSLSKQGTRFYFDLQGHDPRESTLRFYDQAHMIELDHHFYTFDQQHYTLMKNIIELFKDNQYQAIALRNIDLTEFLSEVYPVIQSVLDVKMDSDVQKLTFKEDIQPELYLDYENDTLLIEPVFKYGALTVHPLSDQEDSNQTEKIMVRAIETEAKLLRYLQQFIQASTVVESKWEISGTQEISYIIYNGVPEFSEIFDIYMSDSAKRLRYRRKNNQPISIDVNPDSNLLEISFNLEDISEDELPAIIRQLNQTNKQFHKLSSGSILNLQSEEFQELKKATSRLDLKADDMKKHMQVPLYKGLSFLEDANVEKSEQFIQMTKSLLEPKEQNFTIPNGIQTELRPYQEVGFKWLKALDAYQFGGVLADDMGLGKTLQIITFILSKYNEQGGKYLIVCPSSVLYNWQYEFKKFAPSLNPEIITGNIEERQELIAQMKKADDGIWITSYPLIQRDGELYSDIHFETAVLDESQNVKNASAKTTKAVHRVHATNKFALSGTPIENNLDELWTLFSIVQPGLFSDKSSFKQLETDDISVRIKPFVLRRLKGQVLDDLPEKTETTEYIELESEQKRLYQAQLKVIRNEVQELLDQENFESNSIRVLAGMTRLRQICCHPSLVTDDYDGESAKLERLMEYLQEAKENGKRVVLFSQFTKMLDIIKQKLSEIDMDYHYLDGQTKKEDRLELTARFNEGEKDLFLISLKAGGTGINLTGGDTVILYDSWWNPAIEDQAADRVHRFGQKNAVQVLRLISRGTIEERINELQEKKRELIDSVIETGANKQISSLSKEEILRLLDFE